MTDAFASFHPLIGLAYFAAVIGFAMFLMHPALLAMSLLCATAYALYLRKKLWFALPMLVFTAAMNPLFNHRGATVLAHLPNGNPLTLESLAFGAAAAVMLVAVIAWFACFNAVMTSDKIVYLFGRVMPGLSLILAMSLRFVPLFKMRLKEISQAQRGIGQRRNGLRRLSILVTWALENALETADSMKSRGYGLPGRTAFALYRFTRRDAAALAYIGLCAGVVAFGAATGGAAFRYFPTLGGQWAGVRSGATLAAYAGLGLFPLAVNVQEALIWRHIAPK